MMKIAAAPSLRLSSGIPELDGLVAYLRASRCTARTLEDGSVEVIPPPEADPADDWVVVGLVRSWQDEQGLTVRS